MKCDGFPAIASNDARVLILGTLPGAESLKQQQYYAKKANSFWWIMGKLLGASPEMAYEKRLALLKHNGIALWDVCHSAYRPGSLDSSIVLETIVANDFKTFFTKNRRTQLICFNGQPAARLFKQKVQNLPKNVLAIPQAILPSTSPAHAARTREQKLALWRKSLSPAIGTYPERTAC